MNTNQDLLKIVTSPKPTTIDGVIDWMNRFDAGLPGNDGLKWFNWLYLLVTKAVRNQPPIPSWNRPQWLSRLDVVFANMYFDAVQTELTGTGTVPKSWKVLFEARGRTGIDRIQFALAGMNAHINHDLSLALLQTDKEFGIVPGHSSLEHGDFEHVNGLLATVMPEALTTLATGLMGEGIQSTGKIGRALALWNVRVARDLAWDFADHLRQLPGFTNAFALSTQDRFTGAIGRSLLMIV